MWGIRLSGGDEAWLPLLVPSSFTIGRKGVDIKISHASVSRKHAVLTTEANNVLFIRDTSSFGTEVNQKKLGKSKKQLNSGDKLTLGEISLSVVFRPLSILYDPKGGAEQVDGFKEAAEKLKHVVSTTGSPQTCTHYVVNVIAVTRQFLEVLSRGKQVVSPAFVVALANRTSIDAPLVDEAGYHVLSDGADLCPTEARASLFKGLTLAFSTDKLMKKFKRIISNVGGTPVKLDVGSEDAVTLQDNTYYVLPTDEELEGAEEIRDNVRELLSAGGEPQFVTHEDIAIAMIHSHFPLEASGHQYGDMIELSRARRNKTMELLEAEAASKEVDDDKGKQEEASMSISSGDNSAAGSESPAPVKRRKKEPAKKTAPVRKKAKKSTNAQKSQQNFKRFRKSEVIGRSSVVFKMADMVCASASQAEQVTRARDFVKSVKTRQKKMDDAWEAGTDISTKKKRKSTRRK